MKRIFNKYTLIFIIILISILFVNHSKVDAVSYKSDFVKLEETTTLETDEFEMDLEYTVFSNGTPEKPAAITGYAKRKTNDMYYYHYIVYYYNANKQEIGATDGYNGIWDNISSSSTGSYISSFLEQKNMYNNYKLTDIKYYKLFVEPSTKEITHNYLYNNNTKLNENGLDDITDFNTISMTIKEKSTNETNSQYTNNINSNNYTYLSNSYDYVINNYNIDMVVNEDNTFDITETITAYFNVPKHGIFRKIPLKNSITRLDGTKSNNRAKISNISVNENYTTSNESGYKVIKIGDSNKTLTGSHTYTIKYTYNIGKDPVKNADELYFNLIGDEWDTTINNISFKITMPKSFDKSLLGFSSGQTGSTNSSNVRYNVIGNTITGSVNNTLKPGEALTVRLTLPDGYFVVAGLKLDSFSIFVIIVSLACVFIAYRLWAKYGKDEQVIETVEFYPPEGYNSAEIGFLYEGSASNESIISLLIYLANKGYLKIEETEEKMLFSKSKGFRITKLKEYDGNNECEKIFFNGLFKGGITGTLNMTKAKEIMQEAKAYGEKISFQDALELSMETGATKQSVTATDLYNSFYTTLNRIKTNLNSKENKHKIFESAASGKGKWLILMIIAIFILITVKPILEYGEGGIAMLPFALIFPGIGFTVLFTMVFGKTNSTVYVNGRPSKSPVAPKIFGLVWGGMFGGMPWAFIVLPCLLQNTFHLLTYFIGIVCIAALVIFRNIMPKRTPYGNEMLGKIKGFRRFLKLAEKPQLESLVMQNPEYFYNILPYTYALGVSDVWINQFESIAIEAPHWYDSHDHFSVHTFGAFMSSTMSSASTAMSSSPSSSSGGGGSSGGGSSGGGSGGGGGGSW